MDENAIKFSIISPIYGCECQLDDLYLRIKDSLENLSEDFEIILVNDNSPDNSWDTIVRLSEKDKRVKGINLSRNFGQHYAITAGLNYASGEWIIVIDCDLQDQPEEIVKLYKKVLDGFDVVFGRRNLRQDRRLKKFTSKIFYLIFDYFTDNSSDSSVSNFGIYSKQVIQNYLKLREHVRLFPLLINWLGFKIGYIDVEHCARKSGKSSYNYSKLFNLAVDIIISQSNKPLRLSIKFGFLMSFLSMVYMFVLIIRKFVLDIPLGWTSIMVAIFFIGGLILANLGLLGLYLGKIYDELKDRPLFIIKDFAGELNFKKDEGLLK